MPVASIKEAYIEKTKVKTKEQIEYRFVAHIDQDYEGINLDYCISNYPESPSSIFVTDKDGYQHEIPRGYGIGCRYTKGTACTDLDAWRGRMWFPKHGTYKGCFCLMENEELTEHSSFVIEVEPINGNLTGYVQDKETAYPIPNAKVTLIPLEDYPDAKEVSTTTNEEGYFEFLNILGIKYKAVVEAKGYKKLETEVEVPEGSTGKVRFLLEKEKPPPTPVPTPVPPTILLFIIIIIIVIILLLVL